VTGWIGRKEGPAPPAGRNRGVAMECKDVREKLTLWILDDLSPEEAARVREHLEGCSSCRLEEEQLRQGLRVLRRAPALPASASRRKRLLRQAASQGLVAGPFRFRRIAPAGAAAAAAVLLAVAVFGGWRPGAGNGGPGGVTDVSPPVVETEQPATEPVAWVVQCDGHALLDPAGPAGPRAPEPKDSLFRGDRLVVDGAESRLRICFFEDALVLRLTGDEDGGRGTEVTLGGKTDKDYVIHLDRGRIQGGFQSAPIEQTSSRKRGGEVRPLVITSPTAQAALLEGQEFEATQQKAGMMKNMLIQNPGQGTFSMHFENYDLHRFLNLHLSRLLDLSMDAPPGALEGKRITILCNSLTREEFPDLLDQALGPMGLTVNWAKGSHRIRVRKDGPRSGRRLGVHPAYGEFTLRLPSGKAKISSRNPEIKGAVFVYGGQIGRVRPGLNPDRPLGAPPLLVEEKGMKLKGTFAEKQWGRAAVVSFAAGGGERSRPLRAGETVNGYRVEWVGWDRVAMSKEGREYELRIGE